MTTSSRQTGGVKWAALIHPKPAQYIGLDRISRFDDLFYAGAPNALERPGIEPQSRRSYPGQYHLGLARQAGPAFNLAGRVIRREMLFQGQSSSCGLDLTGADGRMWQLGDDLE